MSGKAAEAKSSSTSPRRTRKNSALSKNQGSTSDIADIFKKQMAEKVESKSRPKISSNKLSQKSKTNTEDLRAVKESIARMINEENGNTNTSKNDMQSSVTNHDDDMANLSENLSINADQSSDTEIAMANSKTIVNNEIVKESNIAPEKSEQKDNDSDVTDANDAIDPNNISNKDILDSLTEVCELVKKLDNDIHHPKDGIGSKIVQLTLRMDNIYTDIHGAVSGILPKISKIEDSMESQDSKIETLESNQEKVKNLMIDMKKLTHDVDLMKGLFQKHSQKLQQLERSVLDLTKRGMEQNLVFHGVKEPSAEEGAENCKETVINFASHRLGIELSIQDIWKAHRSGIKRPDRDRVIITKLAYQAKEKVMENVTKLKDLTNDHNQKIFVNEQIPEGITESRKRVSARLKVLNKANESRAPANKQKIQAMNDKILINGEVDEPEIKPPEPADLFMDAIELKMVKALGSKIKEAKPIASKNSQFVGLAVKIHSVEEMNRAYKAVALRYPSVDHIMAAYAFKENSTIKMGSCDDMEYGGANTILNILKENKVKDTGIFVVRKYGGIHLGYERFTTIRAASLEALKLLRGG